MLKRRIEGGGKFNKEFKVPSKAPTITPKSLQVKQRDP